MSSIAGRAIIVTKTNKSGGALAKGDVVVVDSANDNAVTTTTTGGTTVTVGVVVEENGIANNASGRVQFGGHVSLVTVNASVTRGHYGSTHTVAKQATDAGASRVVGTCMVFTTGGTTPEADLFTQPDASSATGNVATDAIWDAAGDLVQGTGANTAAKLTLGAAGTVVRSTGSTNAYAYPPGYEFDFATFTSGVNITAGTGTTPNDIVVGNAVTYDGSTAVWIEFFAPDSRPDQAASGRDLRVILLDGTTPLGIMYRQISAAAAGGNEPVLARYKLTPSNASHTYKIGGTVSAGTGVVTGGTPSSQSTFMQGYIRITKA